MSNPFDQFDAPAPAKANPFDAFDEPKANPFDQFDASPETGTSEAVSSPASSEISDGGIAAAQNGTDPLSYENLAKFITRPTGNELSPSVIQAESAEPAAVSSKGGSISLKPIGASALKMFLDAAQHTLTPQNEPDDSEGSRYAVSPERQRLNEEASKPVVTLPTPVGDSIPTGAMRGLFNVGTSLTTPENLALMATIEGAPAVIGKVAAAGFGATMAKELPDQLSAIGDAQTPGDKAQAVTEALATAAMVVLSAKHAAGRVPGSAADRAASMEKAVLRARELNSAGDADGAAEVLKQGLSEAPAPAQPPVPAPVAEATTALKTAADAAEPHLPAAAQAAKETAALAEQVAREHSQPAAKVEPPASGELPAPIAEKKAPAEEAKVVTEGQPAGDSKLSPTAPAPAAAETPTSQPAAGSEPRLSQSKLSAKDAELLEPPTPARALSHAKMDALDASLADEAPSDPSAPLRIAPSGKRFKVVNAADEQVGKKTYETEVAAKQALAKIGKRSTFGIPPSENGNDIIDAIIEQGGINLSSLSKEERDAYFPHKGVWRNALTTDNPNLTPDEVARLVAPGEGEAGHGDGDMRTMFSEIDKAIKSRGTLRDQAKADVQNQKSDVKRARQFERVALTPKEGETGTPISELKIGDEVMVDGEKLTVTHIDPDTGNVTMKDGTRWKKQVVEDGKTIYGELKTAEDEALNDWPDIETDKPVDTPKEVEEYAAKHGLTDESQPSLESPPGSAAEGNADAQRENRDGGAGKSDEGAPVASKEPVSPSLPKLRAGKSADELLQGDNEVFNLVSETAADKAIRLKREQAEEKAKAERDAEEAKALQDKQQIPLFGEDSKKPDKIEAFLDKAIENLKGKPGGLFSDPAFIQSVGKPVLRAALQVVRAAYKGGKAAAEAIAEGLAYLRANVKNLDEAKAKAFFDDLYEDAKASEPTPEPPKGAAEPPAPNRSTTGIAQRVHEQRAPGEVEPGQGATPEQMIQQGRDDLMAGADPEAVAAKIDRGEAITGRETALIRAHLEGLSKVTNRAGDAADANPNDEALKKAATDALKTETDFRKRIKPAGTEFHRVGVAMQGETDIDTGSFTGMRRAFSESAGRDMDAAEKAKAKEQVEKIAKQEKEIADLQEKLNTAISGKGKGTTAADVSRTYQKTVAEVSKSAKAAKKSGGSITDFLDAQAEKAKARIIARRGKLLATIDPLNVAGLVDEAIIGASHIGRGIEKLGEWSAKMIEDFGERIRPVLADLFEKSKALHAASVEAFNKVKPVPKPEEVAARAKEEAKNGEELSHKTVYDVARAHINAGVHGENAVMEATHETLKEAYPDLTEKDVRIAYSEYGKMKFPSKEPDKVELAKIRRLTQMQLAIDDLKAGRDPLHSGLQRAKADQEIRDRQAELNDEIKKHAGSGPPSPEKLASRDQAKQTALKNAIEDVDRELKTGEKRERAAGQPDSPETERLRNELGAMRELKKQIEDAANPKKSDADKQIEALTKIRDRLNETLSGKRPANAPKDWSQLSAAAGDIKAEIQAMRELAAQMRRDARQKTDPGYKEEQRQLKALEASIERYRKKTESGDFGAAGKKQGPDTRRVAAMKDVLASRKATYDIAKRIASGKLPTDPTSLRAHFEDRVNNGKLDGKFTPYEIKAIWDRAKVYIDGGTRDFSDMAAGVAADLGLKPEWVKDALSQNKAVRTLTSELYRKMYDRRQAVNAAKQWVESAGKPTYVKVIRAITNYPRAIAVLGHANAMVTHAGQNAFRPSAWVPWGRNLVNNYKFFARPAIHEAAMQALTSHPDYNLALRSKLRVAPGMIEDYAAYGKFLGKIGEAGNRAMDSLKTFRMDLFSKELSKFAPEIRNEVAPMLAQWINHISGFGDIGHGTHATIMREVMFAPGLEASRWGNVVGDPIKYGKILANWKNATPAERAVTKFYINRTAQLATVYLGALAANYGLQVATGQEDRTNFTDPTKSDWMKFKWNGHTYDITGGLTGPLRLLANLFHDVNPANKPFRGEGRLEKVIKDAAFYARGKLDPKYGITADLLDGKTMVGRPLPSSGAKSTAAHPSMSWTEYAWSHAPIPVAEGMREVYNGLEGQGLNSATAREIVAGIVAFVIGSTGVKEGVTPKETQ